MIEDSNEPVEQYVIESLDTQKHNRATFSCGVAPLDVYLKTQANQDSRKNTARTYVLHTTNANEIIGFYTISAASVELNDLPDAFARRLPRYNVLPAMLIGRLAVDRRYGGRGLGGILLANALRRCHALSQEIGSVAVLVDAKDEGAARFYERYGFLRLTTAQPLQSLRLYIPMSEIQGFPESVPDQS